MVVKSRRVPPSFLLSLAIARCHKFQSQPSRFNRSNSNTVVIILENEIGDELDKQTLTLFGCGTFTSLSLW